VEGRDALPEQGAGEDETSEASRKNYISSGRTFRLKLVFLSLLFLSTYNNKSQQEGVNLGE